MKKPVVAVTGDFLLDAYWIGTSTRLSPEAPVPVVLIEEVRWTPGGAGNVKANLEAMGCEVIAPCVDKDGLPTKNRLMVGDHQLARWDRLDECPPQDLSEAFLAALARVDALVIADYGKGSLREEELTFLWMALDCAGKAGITPVFIDSKRGPTPFLDFDNKTFFPNRAEYVKHKKEYDAEARVVLKCGEGGAEFLALGDECFSFGSEARFVRSVSGAGDSVMASFVSNRLRGHSNNTSLYWAMFAAAIAVESPMTTVVSKEQIEERMKTECQG